MPEIEGRWPDGDRERAAYGLAGQIGHLMAIRLLIKYGHVELALRMVDEALNRANLTFCHFRAMPPSHGKEDVKPD